MNIFHRVWSCPNPVPPALQSASSRPLIGMPGMFRADFRLTGLRLPCGVQLPLSSSLLLCQGAASPCFEVFLKNFLHEKESYRLKGTFNKGTCKQLRSQGCVHCAQVDPGCEPGAFPSGLQHCTYQLPNCLRLHSWACSSLLDKSWKDNLVSRLWVWLDFS